MTREEWEAKQNSLKKEYKYVPTGEQGKVEKIEMSNQSVDKNGDPIVTYVDTKTKQDWNDFVKYLDSPEGKKRAVQLGLALKNDSDAISGNELLDSGIGDKILKDYISRNKNTSLTMDKMPLIVMEFGNYRDFALNETKKFHEAGGKVDKNGDIISFGKYIPKGYTAVPEEQFMTWVAENKKTKNPSMVGRYLSKSVFPSAYITQTDPNSGNTVILKSDAPVSIGSNESNTKYIKKATVGKEVIDPSKTPLSQQLKIVTNIDKTIP